MSDASHAIGFSVASSTAVLRLSKLIVFKEVQSCFKMRLRDQNSEQIIDGFAAIGAGRHGLACQMKRRN
jgi:uncharacterized membrane-anchored protein